MQNMRNKQTILLIKNNHFSIQITKNTKLLHITNTITNKLRTYSNPKKKNDSIQQNRRILKHRQHDLVASMEQHSNLQQRKSNTRAMNTIISKKWDWRIKYEKAKQKALKLHRQPNNSQKSEWNPNTQLGIFIELGGQKSNLTPP